MPIPQVNDRIKEAPVVVLRAVFAGIGQILLTADKVRARATEQASTSIRTAATAVQPTVTHSTSAQSSSRPRNGTTHAQPVQPENHAPAA